MRHVMKKIQFKQGKDASDMMMRKLAVNFLVNGKMTTTEKRAKAIKQFVDRIVGKTKERSEANKNFLLRKLAQAELVEKLFEKVGPVVKDKIGGFVKLERLYRRESDDALMVGVSWKYPIVMKEDVKKVEKSESAKNQKEIKTVAK